MEKVTLLNIPNYYSSYYLLGLNKCAELSYQPSNDFKKWNGFPFIIFKIGKKLIVIDNADPVCVRQDLYEEAFLYFTTNKLLESKEYNQPKILPLFPHYPVNCWTTFLKVFKQNYFLNLGFERALKEMHISQKRPSFKDYPFKEVKQPYVFFAGSIWKNEPQANVLRSKFIQACKNISEINFEGGLIPRSDGNNFDMDQVLSPKKYSPKEFSIKSQHSFVAFNNPAVLGAISWRVAEFLNMGLFLLSLPWKIELPADPIHGKEIHLLENSNEIEGFLKFLIKNPGYHDKIARGGKDYFNRYCKPQLQVKRIIDAIKTNS